MSPKADHRATRAADREQDGAIWSIERMVAGGMALSRLLDGRVGLARGALPGERIVVDDARDRRGYVEARRFRVLDPAPERVAPRCPIADACGGCDFLHVESSAQQRLKADIVRDALRRQGGFRELPELAVRASPLPERYRWRLRVHIDERGRVGFLGRGSHRLVETSRCAVARPELESALERLHEAARRHPETAAEFDQAEIRVAPAGPSPVVRLTRRRAPRGGSSAFLAALGEHASIAISGDPTTLEQRFPLGEALWLLVPPSAFVQVNWEVNLQIVAALLAGARARGARTFLDLYSGAGNFLLPLLSAGLTGTGVESELVAAAAARRALAEAGLGGDVLGLPVEPALAHFVKEGRSFDLAVLDPPRSGAAEILPALIALAPGVIAYCSCDPPTWARDLRVLCAAGYRLEAVEGFDMFPETHHVETLAWLRRGTNRGGRPSGGPLDDPKLAPVRAEPR